MEVGGGSVMMCVALGSVVVARRHLFCLLVCRVLIAKCMSMVVGGSALGETDV